MSFESRCSKTVDSARHRRLPQRFGCVPRRRIKGGVSYFLWDRDHPGTCEVTTHFKGWEDSVDTRPLLEAGADVFIRFNEGVSILKKGCGHSTGTSDGSHSLRVVRAVSLVGLLDQAVHGLARAPLPWQGSGGTLRLAEGELGGSCRDSAQRLLG
jgi:hypothetical protein